MLVASKQRIQPLSRICHVRHGTNSTRFGFHVARVNPYQGASGFKGAAAAVFCAGGGTEWGMMALSDGKTNPPKAGLKRDARKPSKDMSDSNLGQALRSVYQRAVSEDIPAEMLDLLGKLD